MEQENDDFDRDNRGGRIMTLTLDDALEAAGLPKVMRIASASTYADVEKFTK